ncbi:hypothetical protein BHE74_00005282 [Ensete ventricosum]|nr:hypothetical protein GW17_00061936 [Ensete ventricosum]RWW86002.1 hypothetical protein BHE74_00005282 [Ensete ventricosum]
MAIAAPRLRRRPTCVRPCKMATHFIAFVVARHCLKAALVSSPSPHFVANHSSLSDAQNPNAAVIKVNVFNLATLAPAGRRQGQKREVYATAKEEMVKKRAHEEKEEPEKKLERCKHECRASQQSEQQQK